MSQLSGYLSVVVHICYDSNIIIVHLFQRALLYELVYINEKNMITSVFFSMFL